jgi:signal transduction histidine kinase/ActR/RegA family two-component response regulator
MHRDGRTFQALVTNQPIFGPDGRVTGMVGVSSDLTERKNLEQQLMQAQKMESIGRLAGGIAHDFNNLLTVIKGTTEVVMAELPAESRHRADLVEVRRAAQRAADLTQHLLAFSRRQVVQPQVIDLNEALRDSERMLRRVMGEDVTVEVRAGQDVGAVRIDPAQLQQVILNLAVNSRDAMPRGGRLTVETSRMTIDPTEAARHAARRPGEWVQITVTDTGSGMDEATRRHAFEPFFTTKGPGRGTGLGLATVYGIVQQGGGSIELESAPGAGTTFRTHLPRVAEAPPANGPAPPPPPAAGSETILVVEDERAVRELVVRKLDMAGYRVLVADDPSDALHIGRTHQGPIHLLLTDVVMPGMDGPALAAKLAHVRPEARVLYITGYAEGHAEDRGLAAADAPLLMKPFDLDTLARTVRQVLDAEVAPGRG